MRRTAVALGLASAWCRAAAADPEIDDKIDAGEAELAQESAQRTKWNELDLHFITLRIGGGALFDWATYWQDAASARQMMLSAATKLRDFRVLLKGQVELLPRVSYTLGYMYDAADQDWRFRQTGIMIAVPELDGQIFVGRTKEGFSTNKLMVGYNGFTIERAAANEAFLPILADGVKWDGQLFENQLVYNAGWFIDTLTEYEKFNMNDRQFAARAVWLPFAKQKQQVLHLAVEYRYGASDDGFLRFKSRPEVFPAQSFAV
ncbi:MAG TPA: hypothetical protein VMJ10_36745, partial [Kofleriaceae bacterium]|nr:hypothetical protein [Kofleriaceae bacterium]